MMAGEEALEEEDPAIEGHSLSLSLKFNNSIRFNANFIDLLPSYEFVTENGENLYANAYIHIYHAQGKRIYRK